MSTSRNKTQIVVQSGPGALNRKMVQYGIKLSAKHPSETNNNFENSYLKSIIYSVTNRTYLQYSN